MFGLLVLVVIISGCVQQEKQPTPTKPAETIEPAQEIPGPRYPKIASWLAKKDEIINSGKPYDLVMTAWFTPEEAAQIKAQNPDAILLAGLSLNWVWDNANWMKFLETVADYGNEQHIEIKESMYLKSEGERCAFGWVSEEWGQEEIYAMDPRSPEWIELITAFYKNVLDQPQHDGIIVDMVIEKSWCPEAISDDEWLRATKALMAELSKLNTENKLIIFNSGRDLSEIDEYSKFMDGYVMENFMGNHVKSTFDDGLKAAAGDYIVIYAVDTDDTGNKDMKKMRLGLTLSMLNDNTYFTYDLGPRDHGQAWWFREYDVDLGEPLGDYYEKDNAYRRDFEKGTVITSPDSEVIVTFGEEYTDVTTGVKAMSFTVEKGDGRIFIKTG